MISPDNKQAGDVSRVSKERGLTQIKGPVADRPRGVPRSGVRLPLPVSHHHHHHTLLLDVVMFSLFQFLPRERQPTPNLTGWNGVAEPQ